MAEDDQPEDDAEHSPQSDLYYIVGRFDEDRAAMQWSEPLLLSDDVVDDRDLALAVRPDGELVAVWRKRDGTIVDDYDFFSTGSKKAVDEFVACHSSATRYYDLRIPHNRYGYFSVLTRYGRSAL